MTSPSHAASVYPSTVNAIPEEDLVEHWTLLPTEKQLIGNKSGTTRLGFAVLLKFFQREARFPHHPGELPHDAVLYLARQTKVPASSWARYPWKGRSVEYHRQQIRDALGFRVATVEDGEELVRWLCDEVLAKDVEPDRVPLAAAHRLRELKIEPPARDQLERLVRSAISTYQNQLFDGVSGCLPPPTRARLDALLTAPDAEETGQQDAPLLGLRADPGRPCLDSIFEEIAKLRSIRSIALPDDLFERMPPKVVMGWRRRAAVEELFELRRHPDSLRCAFLAAFCHLRGREVTDGLVDLLVDTVHRLGTRAERRVERELLQDLRHVAGKGNILFQLAEASLQFPDGRVRDVVYPVASEQTLKDIVREWKASGAAYQEHVHSAMRKSYRSNLRRMLPELLGILEFRSNNEVHRPVIQALSLLRKYAESDLRAYPLEEQVPVDGVVRNTWQELVLERDKDGHARVNRLTYEICALQALREQLRCKEIWVVGGNRYRNPDEDLPTDFDTERVAHYARLDLPLDSRKFLTELQTRMRSAIDALERDLPKNAHVTILPKDGGWISLSPLDAQMEPSTLATLKAEIAGRWPMTGLIDMLKESDLRVRFTDVFRTATAREVLDRDTLQRRLLLCLYGIGTNTGLKRMGSGEHGATYKDLQYTRRRFITKEHLRTAIRQVVNATFAIRRTQVWGEGTTACASDSKKFGAWDQNLMTEWHVRYGGRGIMIYWHVERKSSCIYSQLKSCSSSEVAAMIEGVLRHCTTMEVEKNYVDTHGQSEVAFAFCHLLDFELLPRLKGIHRQRLYRAEAGTIDAYPHLMPVLSRPINWELIGQQYDQMVKYATALKLGTAETESILRRFTRSNIQHPTYRALIELGKVKKTIFLCNYLRSLPLRREIHEGLNVIESWNSANSFIFFGKGGEMATNRQEDQELSMLCLHLLQVSLVYVNTLMIQRVLAEPAWTDRMTAEDLRALTPLIYGHVNPYGTFDLDLTARLPID